MTRPLLSSVAATLLATLCTGCDGLPESGPDCFGPSPAMATNPAERRALPDARERMAERCEDRRTVCRFSLQPQSDGITHVVVEVASIDADGTCRYPVSPDVLVYDISGNYVETIPGL